MTEAQQALILKHQANTPSVYQNIINHLVLTEQYYAASLLAATLEQQEECNKETVRVRKVEQYAMKQELEYFNEQYKELHRQCDLLRMQSTGFQERIEQLLTENAKLRASV